MSEIIRWFPLGTLEETDPLGLDRAGTATCSPQGPGNRGCAFYSKCKFPQIRDRMQPPGHKQPLKGPENVAIYAQNPLSQGGDADIKFLPCFDYYVSGLHQRWRDMVNADTPGSNGVVRILGIAGDGKTYTQREEVKLHEVKNPDCPDCAKNSCIRLKLVRGDDGKPIKREIPRFPRPNQSMERLAAGMEISREVQAEIMREMEAEAMGLFDAGAEEVPTNDEPEMETAETAGGRRKART